MATDAPGLSTLERLEAVLRNPAIYDMADAIPPQDESAGGRPRHYPDFMVLVYESLLSVFRSARRVEAEIAHPLVWQLVRRVVADMHPDRPDLHLPSTPMRRHHYLYGRQQLLTDPTVLDDLAGRHRAAAAAQARSIGLLDPDGPGSWTHPHLSRLLYADGKVVAPLFRAKPGDTRLDKATGELLPRRAETDAGLHWEGTGHAVWGTKFVLVAGRTTNLRGRIIVDVEWVPTPGGEAATAMGCFERLAPLCPGTQGVIYDTALRGTHHQRLLRDIGWLSINKVAARKKGAKTARRAAAEQREEKTVHIETKVVTTGDGAEHRVELYAKGGAIGIATMLDTGELQFESLPRIRTHRNADKSGRYRWYNDYRLPDHLGEGTITVRLHGNAEDEARGLNRTENVRPIAQSDPDFAELYARRNDAESINRNLDDTMWLGRAHSVGHARQHLNLIGFALAINSVAIHEHHKRRDQPVAA